MDTRLSSHFAVIAIACAAFAGWDASAGEVEYLQCMQQFCPVGSPAPCSNNICQRYRHGGQSAPRGRQYGAVAMTAGAVQYGYAWGHSSRAAAESAALRSCAKRSGSAAECAAATWFYDGCAALASSDAKNPREFRAATAAWAGSKREAGQVAMARCVKAGGTACKVDHAFCSL